MPGLIRDSKGLAASLRAIGALRRRASFIDDQARARAVGDIIDAVRKDGDRALAELERRFTGITLKPAALRVSQREFAEAPRAVGKDFLAATKRITRRVREYHRHQLRKSWRYTRAGVTLGQKLTPIEKIGLYVPAGKAPLPSTLIMTAVPAQVAGCRRLVVCTPPNREGKADAHVLAVAATLGLHEVYKVGGAQAVAALAFGTKTIPAVDKIVGPGNAFVVLAKKLLFGVVGIESLPGPSEVAIIADASANPDWIAADLLAQAEHGPDSVCALFTDSARVAAVTRQRLAARLLPLARAGYATRSLQDFGLIAVVDSLDECCALVNAMAPEHLQVMTQHPRQLLPRIQHAGAIFLGHHSPVPLGDYVAGPSHVLPTAGTARFSSGLSVDDFIKMCSLVEFTPAAARRALRDLATFAQAEGLEGHAESARARA